MDVRRPAVIRRLWLPLVLAALGLVVLGAKLSVRSLATGQAVLPGVVGAPVLGPAPTSSPTPSPPRARLRVQVLDQAGQPVSQALVEVRDRFNGMAGQQETGPSGETVLGIKPDSGYVITARKQGLTLGRVEGVDVAPPVVGPVGPPSAALQAAAPQSTPRPDAGVAATAGAPASGVVAGVAGSAAFRGQLVQVRLGAAEAGAVTAVNGARLYVGHGTPRISIIDASSQLLLKHSEPLGPGRQTLFAVARDQSKVFAAWFSAPELLVLNAHDLSVERQVALGAGGITSLSVNPQNGRIWVATLALDSADSGVLHELDPGGEQVLRRVALPQTASNIRFRPDGSILYLPNRAMNTLGFFDPVTGTMLRSPRLPQWPSAMTVSADGRHLYIVNLGGARLLELDAATGEETRAVEVGSGSSAVAAHPDGRRVFVVNQSLGYVQIVDLEVGDVADLVPVGRAPQSLALTPDANGLYVANAGSASISLIDLEKKAVRETLSMGGNPGSLLLVR